MEITEVRIKLMDDPQERLQAFCSITFDECFVVRDLKIIQGSKGPFVAMPSRKLTDRCPRCHTKNHLRASHCNQCGARLDEDRAVKDSDGRARLYADIAHPINSACREMIQQQVLEAFEEEKVRSQEPGYICRYDDFGEDRYASLSGDGEDDAGVDDVSPREQMPRIYQGEDQTHRIEPAAAEPPQPHHNAPQPARENAGSSSGVKRQEESGDEPFGAGLI